MRYLAEVEGKQPAEAFVAFLITQSIATHIEAAPKKPDVWEVWIRDEDALPAAREHYQAFRANPADPKYAAAIPAAREIIQQKQEAARAATKNVRQVEYRDARALTSGRLPPLTLTLLILCIAISILSNFSRPRPDSRLGLQIMDKLSFVSPRLYATSGRDPAASLKRGEIWRVITPIFLHGDPLHLAMNMLALVALGRLAERLVGTPRYALMVLILAALPMMLASLIPYDANSNFGGSPFTIGISGVVYGLVSYLWLLAAKRPELGFRIPDFMIGILLLVVVLGFAGIIQGLSNWAHLGGFVVGLALAWLEGLSGPRR